jgi:hypothetical protein
MVSPPRVLLAVIGRDANMMSSVEVILRERRRAQRTWSESMPASDGATLLKAFNVVD